MLFIVRLLIAPVSFPPTQQLVYNFPSHARHGMKPGLYLCFEAQRAPEIGDRQAQHGTLGACGSAVFFVRHQHMEV